MTRKSIYKSLAGLLALGAAACLVRYAAQALVDHELQRCPLPCHWDQAKGEFRNCTPLEAHLEVKTSREPKGHGTAVWYRASVKNDSCQLIALDYDFFGMGTYYSSLLRLKDTRIEISDANGNPLPPAEHPEGQGEADFATGATAAYPYWNDTAALAAMIKSTNPEPERLISLGSIDLAPGALISASPTIISPHRVVMRDFDTENYRASGWTLEAATIKNVDKIYALPPPGFRKMTEYQLPHDGSYSARFIIHEDGAVRSFENPATPLANRIREIAFFVAGYIPPNEYQKIPVDIKTELVHFSWTR